MSFKTQIKQKLWQWRSLLVVVPSVTLGVLGLRALGLLQLGEWLAYDALMQGRPQEEFKSSVVIVGIDERDIQNIGQGRLSDRVLAQALIQIKAQEPVAIGLDIYRDLPVEPGHAELNQVFRETPNLVGIRKVVGQAGLDTVAPPPVLAELGQVGANDLIVDPDNTVRRSFLSVTDSTDETIYSLSFFLALHYLSEQGLSPEVNEETGEWTLQEASFPALEPNDGGYIKADTAGHQRLINYLGPSSTFATVSLTDVLENRLSNGWGKGKVVLIGKIGESFQDRFYTPHSRRLLDFSVPMTGVEIHAHLTEQIIQAALYNRPQFQFWSEAWEWGLIGLFSFVGAGLSTVKFSRRKHQAVYRAIAATMAIASLLGGSFVAFTAGWWIPVLPAMVSLLGSAGAMTAWKAQSAGGIRRTFGRYLSDDIVSSLLENPDGLKLGGDRRTITILTSDLRGFTATAERLPPEDVIKILNFYLGSMADIITEFQGTIDEFMGDGILVLFGAPIEREDDPQRAIACGISMQLAMEQINQQMEDWGYMPLEMGIGIHTGEVVVGNIGSEKRAKYGVVGSQVNLTYRIESYTTGGQILISEATRSRVGALIEVRETKTVQPKGIAQPIEIFDVGAIGEPYQLALPQSEEDFMTLSSPIATTLQMLKGKDLGAQLGEGEFYQLSKKSGRLKVETTTIHHVKLLMNLRLNLYGIDTLQTDSELYVKVTKVKPEDAMIEVQFTARSPKVHQYLSAALPITPT